MSLTGPYLLIRDRDNPGHPERHSVDEPCPTILGQNVGLGGCGNGQWALVDCGGPMVDPETGKDLRVRPIMKLLAAGAV